MSGYVHPGDFTTPKGKAARIEANLAALELLQDLQSNNRQPSNSELEVLAAYSSWGGLGEVFKTGLDGLMRERHEKIVSLLSNDEFLAAKRSTLNAHFTAPRYVKAIWDFLKSMGVESALGLEPGCGTGNFIGLAPSNTSVVGIELDSTTARIASYLYPGQTIRNESFTKTIYPDGYFDIALGNMPFADFVPFDSIYNPKNLNLHDYFISKSIDIIKPGGLAVFITSTGTLDKQSSLARQEFFYKADLLGAVRLPSGAHSRLANTEVVSDILVFRKREARLDRVADSSYPSWVYTSFLEDNDYKVSVNNYFLENPQQVLGDLSIDINMYASPTITVLGEVAENLDEALGRIGIYAKRNNIEYSRASSKAQDLDIASDDLTVRSIVFRNDEFYQVQADRSFQPIKVPKNARSELQDLLILRDSAKNFITSNAEDLEGKRDKLIALLQRYQSKYGALNRFTLSNPPKDDPDGVPRRIIPNVIRIFRRDAYGSMVLALEDFNDEQQVGKPGKILTQNIEVLLEHKKIVENYHTDNPHDALWQSMAARGRIDLVYIAGILDVEPERARVLIDDYVFDKPIIADNKVSYVLELKAHYLSGDIVSKIEDVVQASFLDPSFDKEKNLVALQQVLPPAIEAEHINARFGANWIPVQYYKEFLESIIGEAASCIDVNLVEGVIRFSSRFKNVGSSLEKQYNLTSNRGFADIINDAAIDGAHKYSPNIDSLEEREKEIANSEASIQSVREAFELWIYKDSQRQNALTSIYNNRFNRFVIRDYSEDGKRIVTPGLASDIVLRPHQKNAIARMLTQPTVGLFHAVGAGKTLEMIVGATELKRRGLIRKPGIIIPNHMLEQFSREWLVAYPQAKILVADSKELKDISLDGFIATCASNDWDAVIMTKDAFSKIGVSAQLEAEYVNEQRERVVHAIEKLRAEDTSFKIRSLELIVSNFDERLEQIRSMPRSTKFSFESMGIDYLCVDEFHAYKNLVTASKVYSSAGSQLALDMDMKFYSLRKTNPNHVACVATATPVANKIYETHTMMRFLVPDLLEKQNLLGLDAFLNQYIVSEQNFELGVNNKYRMVTRETGFTNLPELISAWSDFSDTLPSSMLNISVPSLAIENGVRRPKVIAVEPSPTFDMVMQSLIDRAEKVKDGKVKPHEDNMLNITTDGRKIAADPRLLGINPVPGEIYKIDMVADNVFRIYQRTKNKSYSISDGSISDVKGSIQLVFCDFGTPNSDNTFSMYEELKTLLVHKGIPASEIKFIHDAPNSVDKAKIFEQCRNGAVKILVGSTQKMGTGTNIQDRAIALHHVDCPWRPADVTQREGRIIRQGNQNTEVEIFRYVTKNSFDAYMWQTVERKEHFISQIISRQINTRDAEIDNPAALSYAEVKAIASGDPVLLVKAKNDELIKKLTLAKQRYDSLLFGAKQLVAKYETLLPDKNVLLEKVASFSKVMRENNVSSYTHYESAPIHYQDNTYHSWSKFFQIGYILSTFTTHQNKHMRNAVRYSSYLQIAKEGKLDLELDSIEWLGQSFCIKSQYNHDKDQFDIVLYPNGISLLPIRVTTINHYGNFDRTQHHLKSLSARIRALPDLYDEYLSIFQEIETGYKPALEKISKPFSQQKEIDIREKLNILLQSYYALDTSTMDREKLLIEINELCDLLDKPSEFSSSTTSINKEVIMNNNQLDSLSHNQNIVVEQLEVPFELSANIGDIATTISKQDNQENLSNKKSVDLDVAISELAIPNLYTQDNKPFSDQVICAHLVHSNGEFWITEYNSATGVISGYGTSPFHAENGFDWKSCRIDDFKRNGYQIDSAWQKRLAWTVPAIEIYDSNISVLNRENIDLQNYLLPLEEYLQRFPIAAYSSEQIDILSATAQKLFPYFTLHDDEKLVVDKENLVLGITKLDNWENKLPLATSEYALARVARKILNEKLVDVEIPASSVDVYLDKVKDLLKESNLNNHLFNSSIQATIDDPYIRDKISNILYSSPAYSYEQIATVCLAANFNSSRDLNITFAHKQQDILRLSTCEININDLYKLYEINLNNGSMVQKKFMPISKSNIDSPTGQLFSNSLQVNSKLSTEYDLVIYSSTYLPFMNEKALAQIRYDALKVENVPKDFADKALILQAVCSESLGTPNFNRPSPASNELTSSILEYGYTVDNTHFSTNSWITCIKAPNALLENVYMVDEQVNKYINPDASSIYVGSQGLGMIESVFPTTHMQNGDLIENMRRASACRDNEQIICLDTVLKNAQEYYEVSQQPNIFDSAPSFTNTILINTDRNEDYGFNM